MDSSDDVSAYVQRLELFRRHDYERDQMIQAYKEKCDDYNNEVESRRMWQTKANNFCKEVLALNQANESNPFVFAVIDGDGAVFQEDLLKRGAEGGAEAGYLLWTEIKNYITDAYPEAASQDWNIVVQVVLNMDGLAKKLHASGIVPNTPTERTLAEFARGFGRAQPLFSFIDVGSGKESADHKVRELLRWMVRVNQCKHIFFGPCHDAGYLPVLEPYKLDSTVSSRLTLIETTPAEEGFKSLGFHKINFKSVFKSDKLPERVVVERQPIQRLPPPTVPASQLPPPKQLPVQHTVSSNSDVSLKTETPVELPRVLSPPSNVNGGPNWSTLTKSVAPKAIDISSTKKSGSRKYYLLNADSQRVDEPLPKNDPSAEKRFKDRSSRYGNLCNAYHLHNNCKSDDCQYHHGERLPPGELLVLKQKSRGIPCSQGSDCIDVNCMMGHHCRWLGACNHSWCRFGDYHDIDSKPRLKVFEDGSTQIVNKL
ncbi:hypothetical protein CCHL11_08279 [Colletotrichum chlorophyti]|uniref:C3H1-type domain-containing protein n=1 Tax=Colletotrichum chlorophyti TaxID=708187 RepID=A0A1Q8RMX5_9PEZI|nr:hypothetical protein CCHL11_08279 [Colletotrichum chlorophyti]